MLLETTLLIGMALLFAGLALAAERQHRQFALTGARELALVAVLLGLVASFATLVESLDGTPALVVDGLLTGALALMPYLVLRFSLAFEPLPGRAQRNARVVTVGLLVLAGFATAAELPGIAGSTWTGVLLVIFGAIWLAVHAFAAYRLWRGGREVTSTVGRRRAQLMAAGLLGLGVVMVVAIATGAVGDGDTGPSIVVGSVAVVAFLLGFAPPQSLRWQWSRRDRAALDVAEIQLVRGDDPQELVRTLLPPIERFVGAEAAWLTSGDAEVGRVGDPDETAVALTPRAAAPAGEIRIVNVPGRERWLLAASTGGGWLVAVVGPYPMLFGARNLDALRGLAVRLEVAVDRARLRERERESIRRYEEARRVAAIDRVKDDVLATVSHELRTPLTTVCGATELLLARWELFEDEDRRAFVERVASNAAHLHRVVQDLLDLTSLRVNTDLVNVRTVPVRELVDDVADRLGPAIRRHTIERHVPEGLQVELDPEPLSRVLEHLIVNAAKFSSPGSAIRVEAFGAGEEVAICVVDRGIGMSQDELDQIFDPFFRSGDVLHRETRGLGVGLAVVAGLIRALGARIEVDSEPGAGSRFTVYVPASSSGGDRGRATPQVTTA